MLYRERTRIGRGWCVSFRLTVDSQLPPPSHALMLLLASMLGHLRACCLSARMRLLACSVLLLNLSLTGADDHGLLIHRFICLHRCSRSTSNT